ncbi:MAG: transcription elongation factor GreA [Bdellovibrionales bacterium]|nr:transcription elongation factor GreA [Bdellovibrionales bacterium]
MIRRPITADGKKRLDELLKRLIKEERPKVIQAIKEARAHGDLSENADYDAAKEQQALLEGRISDLSEKLSQAQVVDVSKISSDKIIFGASIELKDLDKDEIFHYQIVGEEEADVKQGRISINSPLAKKMIGLKKNNSFLLQTPKGEREYQIINFYFK